ncbi:MFS transporter [Streptomyces sp. M19]
MDRPAAVEPGRLVHGRRGAGLRVPPDELPLGTGLAFMAETLPALLLAPLAGVLVDRFDRLAIMISSDLLRAGVVLAMLAVDSADTVWLLYAALFAQNAVSQFFAPAHQATIPWLVGRGPELDSANAWYAVSSGVVRLAGAPLGGALYAFAGFDTLVLVNCASYAVSAVLLTAVRAVSARTAANADPRAADGSAGSGGGVLDEVREGCASCSATGCCAACCWCPRCS